MRWHAMSVFVLLSACSNAPLEPVQAPSSVAAVPTQSVPSAGVSGSAVAGSVASAPRAGTGAALPQVSGGSTASALTPTAGTESAAAGSGNAGALAGAAGHATTAAAGVGAAGVGAAGMTSAAGAVAAAGTSGAAGAAGGSAGAAASGNSVPGCEGSTLLALPQDTLKRGPWPVGNKTVKIGRLNTVEVFYPAQPGSEQGKEVSKYDLRVFLPKNEQSKVPDAEATILSADTYRDLPLDTAHGPYPVMILVHGTAAFRVASLSSQALWASRGFAVMVADHPGLYLADYIACGGQVAGRLDLSADVDAELEALTTAQADLAFLMGHVDMKRVALAGHSAGAWNVAEFATKPGVQVIIPLAGTQRVTASASLKSVAFVAGMSDSVLPYGPGGSGFGSILYPGSDVDAYTATRGSGSMLKKRLLGITNGGHLTVTDLCKKNSKNQSDLEVAQANGVCGVASIVPLADCGAAEPVEGIAITNDFVTAVLEETLQCQDRATWISGIKMRHPAVGELREAMQ